MASVFTRIMKGELPGHVVLEDDRCVVIMTIQPLKPGHVLVIPREETDHWDDLDAPARDHLMAVSHRVAKAIKRAFPCKRVGLLIAGLEVPHVHIHLFPLDTLQDINFENLAMADQAALADAAARLRAALA
ncbi:MAG: HIT family protein [Pseudomonadota bacterium]